MRVQNKSKSTSLQKDKLNFLYQLKAVNISVTVNLEIKYNNIIKENNDYY